MQSDTKAARKEKKGKEGAIWKKRRGVWRFQVIEGGTRNFKV